MFKLLKVISVFLFSAIIFIVIRFYLQESPPHYKAVMKLMEPLEYSGLSEIVGKNSDLEINFDQRKWTLHNVHRFDKEGNVVLEDNKKGLCGRLSRHMYFKLREIFSEKQYEIKFCKVIEKRFFNTISATHIVVSLRDNKHNREYIIDPTFKIYALKEAGKDYILKEYLDADSFIKFNKNTDKYFEVNFATPIFIRKDYMISFSVESIGEEFDKNHYILAVNATKSFSKSSVGLFIFRFIDGHFQDSFDNELTKQLLTPEEFVVLYRTVLFWTVKIQNL